MGAHHHPNRSKFSSLLTISVSLGAFALGAVAAPVRAGTDESRP